MESSLDIIEKGKVTRVAVPLLTENRMELFELDTTAQ